jgi:SAM-dependent methyltransferase
MSDPHNEFPSGFFSRADETPDDAFYVPDRFVTHIDDRAIAAVGALYTELGLTGSVLDIMSSWISHFVVRPQELVAMGMNARELARNVMTHQTIVQDLNVDPRLPFEDERFDAVTCCVSIDYLTRPVAVLLEASRVLKPGGVVVCTFSNRCFPTKAIRGWLSLNENARCELVARYLELAGFTDIAIALRTPPNTYGDPLYAVTGRAKHSATAEAAAQ